MEFRSFNAESFKRSIYFDYLSKDQKKEFEVTTKILHFKINSYVLENLICWDDLENDAIFKLTFPSKGMVLEADYKRLENRIEVSTSEKGVDYAADFARKKLYPPMNPAFSEHIKMPGVYHLFPKTLELFPSKASTCHSYCTYCHRWMPLVEKDARFTYSNDKAVVEYIKDHPEIEDVIFSGGDPLVMKVDNIKSIVDEILSVGRIKSIRFISKSLAWWPYRFLTDSDSDDLLNYFSSLVKSGIHVTITAHFTHPKELEPPVVKKAVDRILGSGVVIRCQGPIVSGINDDPKLLALLWKRQVQLGMIPYYLFVEFNYGPSSHFKIPVYKALTIFKDAMREVPGLAKTIRGPVISDKLMKLCIEGVADLPHGKFFILKCINAKDKSLVGSIFFEEFCESSTRLRLDCI